MVLAGFCFGVGHGYQGMLGIVQTTSAGLVLETLAVRRQGLWPCMDAYLAIDTFGLLALKALRPEPAFFANGLAKNARMTTSQFSEHPVPQPLPVSPGVPATPQCERRSFA